MQKTSEYWMMQAVQLAAENVRSGQGGPFGALIVKDGEMIASGVNLVTTQNDPTAHAEIVAIRRACEALKTFQLEGCELYASCEPCPMCLGAIYWARPAAYYFACTRADAAQAGFDDAFIYEQLPLRPQERSIPTRRIPVENASAPFELWARSPQKRLY